MSETAPEDVDIPDVDVPDVETPDQEDPAPAPEGDAAESVDPFDVPEMPADYHPDDDPALRMHDWFVDCGYTGPFADDGRPCDEHGVVYGEHGFEHPEPPARQALEESKHGQVKTPAGGKGGAPQKKLPFWSRRRARGGGGGGGGVVLFRGGNKTVHKTINVNSNNQAVGLQVNPRTSARGRSQQGMGARFAKQGKRR